MPNTIVLYIYDFTNNSMTNEIGGIKLFETISFFYNYADVNFPKYCVYVDKGLFCRCEIMMLKCKLYKKSD